MTGSSRELMVRRLRGATLLRLTTIGSTLGLCIICSAISIPASLGVEIIQWNGEFVVGASALLYGPLIGFGTGLLLGLLGSVPMYLGLRCYSLVKPLRLEYVEIEPRA